MSLPLDLCARCHVPVSDVSADLLKVFDELVCTECAEAVFEGADYAPDI
jgi:hypothetical protein